MGQPRLDYRYVAERHPARRDLILTYWTGVHRRTLDRYHYWRSVWGWYYLSGAQCVHNREGNWTSNTGNGYYGGFQYDIGTWIAAGGTTYAYRADLASPTEQVIVTKRKVTRYGWGAWPNTARECGLL
jgi:hypothetical protein